MTELRLSATQRITGVIWGVIVAGSAVTAMVALSGTDIEIVNVIIVALVALGTWLLASALSSVRPRKSPSHLDVPASDAPDDSAAVVSEVAEAVARDAD